MLTGIDYSAAKWDACRFGSDATRRPKLSGGSCLESLDSSGSSHNASSTTSSFLT